MTDRSRFAPLDSFAPRHIGPSDEAVKTMLHALGMDSLDALIDAAVPASIRLQRDLNLPAALGERAAVDALAALAAQNTVARSLIGAGYADCITPPVIQRNILENPGWYTQYTPYQAEIAQGRLEALLNFQTMVCELTGLPLAGASLLDEATAAAEAVAMAYGACGRRTGPNVLAADDLHPQTLAVVQTRAEPVDLHVHVAPWRDFDLSSRDVCAVIVQYPTTDGALEDYRDLAQRAHDAGALVIVAADLLALTLLEPPGRWGADVVVGNTQRFGVPLGYGGPHAAFFATTDDHKRRLPGRLVGVSRAVDGSPALRLALQTREQHIRRDRATSNICTSQVLLAIVASMYAVYHGPDGLTRIAQRVHDFARAFAAGLDRLGLARDPRPFFDTVAFTLPPGDSADALLARAQAAGFNLRRLTPQRASVTFDERATPDELGRLLALVAQQPAPPLPDALPDILPPASLRTSPPLEHPIFRAHASETELLRYIHRLQSRDLSLTTSMIPLGSCTMKLNATTEMLPVTWPAFNALHPFAPRDQAAGYAQLFDQLEAMLAEITGFHAVSLQPNAGSQGEYAGLLVIRAYHRARGDLHRRVCLIPESAHGTNPASAVMAGFKVVPVRCDDAGNIDLDHLHAAIAKHRDHVGALMVTYPSTHGVFEDHIRAICDAVHDAGGQVYMDGANLNAQVGLCRPGDFGADVCHLNLHKTFCIPHGGGGPGMGPIGVAAHLAPFLPSHPVVPSNPSPHAIGPVSAAPWGSPSILTIPWLYIRMMGPDGLTQASRVAILSANYIAHRLQPHYPVLYRGSAGLVAHECIIDLRPFKDAVSVADVAKRLMDYGFHAPTVSWPVPGTMMIEPTESESLAELDRFCDAMIAIRAEIRAIEAGDLHPTDNPLANAPHTAPMIAQDHWPHPYTRAQAAYPAPWCRDHKFWPHVRRIDEAFGDRNLICTCPPMSSYADDDTADA